MNNEYDYSGLYQHNNGNEPPQNSYPNVGSSGANTANTARTDYSQPGDGGYTSSYQSGQNGYNGYSYSSAPQQPPQPPRRNHGGWGRRILAGVLCVALGFGGGLGGAVVAGKMGLTGGQVVVQQVVRDESTVASNAGSTGGTDLSLQEVSAIVQPSVVVITTEKMVSANTWFGGSYVQSGAGSGVIISEDGYILTCAHVVSGASNVKVTMQDDTEYTASLVGGDTAADIAVLKVDASGLTPAVLGDSDTLAVGETAIAVGNPMGTLGGTVTNGIVSALNREVTVNAKQMTLIQTNAAISPGNSGGGLFNGRGELIGIVNAKSGSVANGSVTNAEGLGFAIPINTAMSVAQELIDNGYVKRPVLGITVITATSDTAAQYGLSTAGVYITSVNPGSGAERAGLEVGDRIISIGDSAVSQSADVTGYLEDKAVGDSVTLQVEREGKIISVDVTLTESTGN